MRSRGTPSQGTEKHLLFYQTLRNLVVLLLQTLPLYQVLSYCEDLINVHKKGSLQ